MDVLSSCGHALSQGDGTEKQLPLVTGPVGELGDDWLHAMGPHLPKLTMAAQKSWKNTGMLAGVADCRRSQKWAAKEDGHWDLNLGPAAIERRETTRLQRVGRTTRLWGRKKRPCSSEGRSEPRGSEASR